MSRFAVLAAVALSLLCAAWPVVSHAEDPPKASHDMHFRPVPETPEWKALKALAGHWEASIEEHGQKRQSRVEIRVTADGSALMHVLDKDTPHEMVTMFHPDGKRILATHYCAAHNQPRMALVPGPAANQLTFDFVDGTNIEPGDGHMRRLVITVVDAEHHDEAWTFRAGGSDMPAAVFHFARRK